jgi:hypothetical protein
MRFTVIITFNKGGAVNNWDEDDWDYSKLESLPLEELEELAGLKPAKVRPKRKLKLIKFTAPRMPQYLMSLDYCDWAYIIGMSSLLTGWVVFMITIANDGALPGTYREFYQWAALAEQPTQIDKCSKDRWGQKSCRAVVKNPVRGERDETFEIYESDL